MADPQAPRVTPHAPLVRPVLWRLPLIAFLVIGLGCLRYLDELLQREYRAEATTQAVQTDALLEGFLRQRVGLLHSLEVMLASDASGVATRARFPELAAELFRDAPDALAVTFLDRRGIIRVASPAPGAGATSREGTYDSVDPVRAAALARAELTGRAAFASSVRLFDGSRGVVVYDPVRRDGRLLGFVGGAFTYGALFTDALGGQLQGEFAYRVRDAAGHVLGESPDHPGDIASLITREVTLPDGEQWQLEVAIPRFQPFMARVILWGVGLLLLALVVFLVMREEQRAERLAAHSFHLEQLSRELLDANMRLEDRAAQVTEANRAKSRFLANVSHELRTPLNAIVGYNGLALDGVYGDLTPTLAAAHRRIGQAAEHLLGVVNDVLDLSKIEVGRMKAELEPTDLGAVVDSVTTVVDPIAAAKEVSVDVVLARDLPRVTTDPRHVRQILLNLVSNAVKFTERGTVAIVVRRDEGEPERRVAIAVHDSGVGIAPGDQQRIFDEFEQVRPSGRGDSQQRGTGVGLAIARKLARLLGGEIQVRSELGAGSQFTLVLPIEPPASLHEQTGDGDTPARGVPITKPAISSEGPRFTPVVPSADARRDVHPNEAITPTAWQLEQEATPPDARPALPRDDRGGVDGVSGGD